jgi:uncharacterized repeat protein (TIGR01451 family)
MKSSNHKKIKFFILIISFILIFNFWLFIEKTSAGSYDGEDLALAILNNASTLVSSSYWDRDDAGYKQAIVLSSLGTIIPTDGTTFAFFSTGIAGANPVTTNSIDPGDERGTWYKSKFGHPRDEAELTMILTVPSYMHYLYYDVQFFSTEYPEYIGSKYNDVLTITVVSPSQGTTQYSFDVNSGYFILDSLYIPGTGFDIFAQSGDPADVDWVGTNPIDQGADAGASDIIPIGGNTHPVSPNEQITVTINIKDDGDNQFDSAAFIDNLRFTGYAKTEIIGRKYVVDKNGGMVESNDTIEYTITLSNIGNANQQDNNGNEFEDIIPNNTTYVNNSLTYSSGIGEYILNQNKIIWNGEIPSESSVSIKFSVKINDSLANATLIRNQGVIYWDSNEDFTNNAIEYTDNPHIDNGIDEDGDNETDDDDPTDLIVQTYHAPSSVTENFIDDIDGENATQYWFDRLWFETTKKDGISNFKVVDCYQNKSANAFKTQLRANGGDQYWYYHIPAIEGVLKSWKISFRCANATEESTIGMDFYNSDPDLIAKLKFKYVKEGLTPPVDYVIKLYYWSPTTSSWKQLFNSYQNYLFDNWYTLKIEIINEFYLRYSLYRIGAGLVDSREDLSMDPMLTEYIPGSMASNLQYIKWYNTNNPMVCPMIIWDDHIIELIK